MGFFILLLFAYSCITAICTLAILHRLKHPPRKTYASALARDLPTSPAEIGMTFVEQTFTFSDNTQTPVWRIEGDGPADTAMIVTHGFGDSRYGALTWLSAIKQVAGLIIVYDARAHGESTARRAGITATERDDLIELIEGLDLPPRVVLFGYSMGAVISISAAGALPEHLRSRVVGVIADGPYRKPMEPVIGHLRQSRYPAYPMVWLVDAHIWFWLNKYTPFDRAQQAAAMTCPLLVLHGTADTICKYTSAQEIAAATPHGELITFDDGGHLDLASRWPERYSDAVTRFTESIQHEQ